jgi:hypothetical protein
MVEKGLVRAYGVCRSAPDLMSRDAGGCQGSCRFNPFAQFQFAA